MRQYSEQSNVVAVQGLLGELYALVKSRKLGFFWIKHISRVCGPKHVMPTCMNFSYRTTDLQSFVMAASLFLKNCREDHDVRGTSFDTASQ